MSRRAARWARPAVLVVLAAVLAAGLAGWLYWRAAPQAPGIAAVPVPGFPDGLSLLLSADDAGYVTDAAPVVARRVLGGPATVVLGGAATRPGRTSLGAVFTSYATFRQDLGGGQIPAGVRAVSYDPERWPATPAAEQANPIGYMRLFARLAGHAGYTVILVPGRDLMLVRGARCRQQRHETLDTAFLRCGLPAAAARLGQVFEMQIAPEELDPARAASFAAACAEQARAANPHVAVLATLSTAPAGYPVTSGQLARAAAAIRPFVQGFQLNLTQASVRPALPFLRTVQTGPAG